MFPDACILEYAEFEPWLGLGLKVQVWFSDIDPPKKLSVFGSDTVIAVVTCRRVRDFRAGEWAWQAIKLMHADCGGSTDGHWSFHVYRRVGAPALVQPPP